MHERDETAYTVDDFLDIWDHVPLEIISEEFWDTNFELIKAITYDLYRIEEKSGANINVKLCARRLESILSNLFKYGMLNVSVGTRK